MSAEFRDAVREFEALAAEADRAWDAALAASPALATEYALVVILRERKERAQRARQS